MEKSISIDGYTFTKDNVKVIDGYNYNSYNDEPYKYLYIVILSTKDKIHMPQFMYKNNKVKGTNSFMLSKHDINFFNEE